MPLINFFSLFYIFVLFIKVLNCGCGYVPWKILDKCDCDCGLNMVLKTLKTLILWPQLWLRLQFKTMLFIISFVLLSVCQSYCFDKRVGK